MKPFIGFRDLITELQVYAHGKATRFNDDSLSKIPGI